MRPTPTIVAVVWSPPTSSCTHVRALGHMVPQVTFPLATFRIRIFPLANLLPGINDLGKGHWFLTAGAQK